MIIKLLCTMEAYHTPLLWTTPAIVSNVPLYVYFLILLFDFFLYYIIALLLAWNHFRVKEKVFLCPSRHSSMSSSDLFSQWSPKLLKSGSWFNSARLGIPFSFQASSSQYSQIPENDTLEVEELDRLLEDTPKNSVVMVISSLCKSYETIDGSPIEVLKNINGDLKKGTITTLLGR